MTWLVRFTPVETALGSILCMIWDSKRTPALFGKAIRPKIAANAPWKRQNSRLISLSEP